MPKLNMEYIDMEHKKDALATYCTKRGTCLDFGTGDECPLFRGARAGGNCYTGCDKAEIDRNYELVFGDKESVDVEEAEPTVDMINHPPHYTNGGMEAIDEMCMVFGTQAVKYFCICNVWKYRKRALYKNGQEDMDKADWYMNKFMELQMEDLENEINNRLP